MSQALDGIKGKCIKRETVYSGVRVSRLRHPSHAYTLNTRTCLCLGMPNATQRSHGAVRGLYGRSMLHDATQYTVHLAETEDV